MLEKNRIDFAHFIIFLSGRATMMSPPFSSLFFFVFFFMATAGKQNVCVWFCVCLRYWMDSIYNWMFLSSLTIILPSMTTFFNLFAALNGYYFCFCLFYIAMFFLSCFYHAVSCSIYVIFFRLYVFFVIALDQIYSLFVVSFLCVCVFLNPFLIFPHSWLYKIHIFTYIESIYP